MAKTRALRLLVTAVVTVALGCSDSASKEDAMMKAGLDALYVRHDPYAAAAQFRKVVEIDPGHYGATYQLAAALDAAGKPKEARPIWEKVLAMAEAGGDQATIDTARSRLETPAGPSENDLMQAGVDALYAKRDPNSAIALFTRVLQRNPDHYGANYQIAAGKKDDARIRWEKVLKLAETYKDQPTIDTAKTRLAAQ